MEKQNKQKDKRLYIIVPLLLIIILLLICIFVHKISSKENHLLKVSDIQVTDEVSNKIESKKTTKIIGDDLDYLSKNNPYIYLRNDKDNSVYLQFDVCENDEVVYSSNLIEPGKLEQINICSLLSTGEHKLVYHITSYDLESHKILLSGIKQIKNITIN